MADNVELNAGTGGVTLSTDEVTRSTVVQHVQYVKLMNGTDAAIDVIPGEATNGLDVDVTRVQGTVTVDGSGVTQPVSAASLPLPTGAATSANQTTIIGHVDGIEALLTTIDSDTSNLANLHSADYDTAGGTDTTVAIGLAIPSNGGAAAVTTTNPLPVQVYMDGAGSITDGGAGNATANTLRVVVASNQAVIPISDNSGSLTVDNAALSVTGGGVEATALRVTLASDSTGVLSIDDNGGAITVDGTVSVSGEVDVTPGTPAANSYLPVRLTDGSAFISSTSKAVDDAAGGTDSGIPLLAIRDDSLTTLTPVDGDYVNLRVSSTGALHVTGGGGGTEYSEDVASPATIVGTATMMERDDALATLTPIEGDWAAMRCNSTGALWTAVTGTVTVDGSGVTQPVSGTVAVTNAGITTIAGAVSGTEMQVDVLTLPALAAGTNNIGDVDVLSVVPGTGATNLGKAIDTATGATDTGVLLLATRDDALAALTPIEGDNVQLRTDANGALWVIPSGTTAVSGTVTANLAAGTNNIGDVDILSIAAGDNNIGNVDVVTLPNVTLAAGTNTNEVVGDAAHDAAAAGNPVGIGGVAQTMDDTAPPNRVSAEGDATRLATSLDGAIFAHPHGPQVWSYHVNGSTALTDTTVHASPGAGLSLYVTDIVISSGAATAINVFFEESSTTVLGPYYLEAVAGRGCAIHFGTPKKITAATALTVTSSAAIAHAIDVTGYIAPG